MLKIFLFVLIIPHISAYYVQLHRASTLFVPKYDSTGNAVYEFDSGTTEQLAYDDKAKILYTTGFGALHVIDVSNIYDMKIIDRKIYPNLDLTDVEFCGDYVFFAVDNQTNEASRLHGIVYVLKKYDTQSPDSLHVVHQIQVGALPDMIKPTKDCTKVIVAIEAEAFGKDAAFQDPKGGVGIIQFPNGIGNGYNYTELDFTKFNSEQAELEKDGVRFVYRKNSNTFDRDIEPEYITFNCDETLAYLALQENNAIAVVNLRTMVIEEIKGLGYKTWNQFKLDPSDKDGGINMNSYASLRSFYLPDSIHYHQWNGENIIITANEGDAKDYEDLNGFNEELRGSKFTSDQLSDKIPASMKADLANDTRLGRLVFTTVDGLDSTGKYENLYFFGGRGFTIRRASDMTILYDSGDVMEEKTSYLTPEIFNANGSGKKTPRQTLDTRSDNKGPETESIATAEIGGRLLIFVGNERPGTIAVFSVGDNFTETKFEYLYHNIGDYDKTFNDLYNERNLSEIDTEDLRFVPADKSPSGKDIIFAAGSVSGTISALEVNVEYGQSSSTTKDTTTGDSETNGGIKIGNMICISTAQYNNLLRQRGVGKNNLN